MRTGIGLAFGQSSIYSSCPGRSAKRVFALDVPGIHVFLAVERKDVDGRDKPGHDEVCCLRLVAEIRLDRSVDLDGQRIAVAVLGITRGDAHPAFADAIFLDIGLLDALE